MSTVYTSRRQVKEVRSPDVYPTEADAAAFGRLREQRFALMDEQQALMRASRPVEDIRALKAVTDDILTQTIPDFVKTRERIVERFTPRFHTILPETIDLHPALFLGGNEFFQPRIPPRLEPVANAGELWWAQTAFFCSLGGLTVDLPDDRVHLFGHVGYNGDDLLAGSCGYIENYVLSPDRFPRTPKTSFGIETETRIGGVLSGWTGLYHPIWHADDKWCKCWQVTRKTAYLSSGQILANVENVFQFIDLHNVGPVGQQNSSVFGGFGGLLQFDADLSALASSGTSILVDIETRYDIQLEGESDIWFRRTGGTAAESVPSMENAVLFKSRPMSLQPR
jgi:hypothetical protein